MKTRYIIIILLFTCLIGNAQTVYLTTPKGSKVYAFERAEMSANDIQRYTNQARSQYPQAEVLANASATYNCHSYAWNLSEGGTQVCWLNQDPDLHLYWDDGSYTQTNESEMKKIFYYNGDHSAIKSATHSGMYESKWGSLPLMRHAPTYGPSDYNMSYRHYYKASDSNIEITGSRFVCPAATNYYSIANLPSGSTVTWGTNIVLRDPMPKLAVSSTNANECTLTNTYSYPCEFILEATIVLPNGNKLSASKNIVSDQNPPTIFTGTYTQISAPTVNVVNKAFNTTAMPIQPNIEAAIKFTNVSSRPLTLAKFSGNGTPVSWYYNSSNYTLYVILPNTGGSVFVFTVGNVGSCATSDFTLFASSGAPKSLGITDATVNVYELMNGTKVYTSKNVMTDTFDLKSTNLKEGYYILEVLSETGERTTTKVYLKY